MSRNPAFKNEPALYVVFLFLVSRNPAIKNEPALYVLFLFWCPGILPLRMNMLYVLLFFWCPGIQPLRMNLLYMLLFLVSRNPASKNEPAVYVVVFGVQESCL